MPDRGDEQGGVAVVQAGDGVAEVEGDGAGEACQEQEDAAFAAGAGKAAAVQDGDVGIPVDGVPSECSHSCRGR